jgi:large subunit ribosomal protein L17
MFRNMVTSLLREERVATTIPKAKEVRRVAERMITFAKRGDLHARRQAARVVRDPAVLKRLFDEIGPRFSARQGGYTRILKTGFRAGDMAPMSILELLPDISTVVEAPAETPETKAPKPKKDAPKAKADKEPALKKTKERKPKAEAKTKPERGAAKKSKAKADKPAKESKAEKPKPKVKSKPKKSSDKD